MRNAEALRFALPAYVCFVLVIVVDADRLGHALTNWSYFNSLLVLTSFLAVLALGQGAVILTGGLDLSVPWTIGLCGILLAGMVKGSDAALLYALPVVLLVGAAVGFVNGARHRRARRLADRHDAGDQRHPAGSRADLFATARRTASPRRCCAGS